MRSGGRRWLRRWWILGWFCLLQPVLFADDGPLGGASVPRPPTDSRPTAASDYKRWGQYAVKRLAVGDQQDAEAFLSEMLAIAPDDSELMLLQAAAVGTRGDVAAAQAWLLQALAAGLPPGRVLAGPRVLSEPLSKTETYRRLRDHSDQQLLHGPMLGAMTDRSVDVWVRTAEPAQVTLEAQPVVGPDTSPEGLQLDRPGAGWLVATGATREGTDRTTVLQLKGLYPQTTYRYRVRINDGEPIYGGHFTTWPAAGSRSRFSIAFGGGAGFHPPQERVWRVIASHRPAALLLLGDNIYSDDPETPAVQDYCYYRRQSRPEFRDLGRMTPVLSIWDDHDFGTDDAWGGPERDRPHWKLDVWRRFTHNWANPAYAHGETEPGVWYDFTIGEVDFFMLDGRYWRTNSGRRGEPPIREPDMLGPAQEAWLCDRLAASSATFKVIVSPVPWDFRSKTGIGGLDTWAGFPQQRERIFRFLSERGIEGVLLISADRHRSDAWRIDRDGDYPLFEFNSSRLTNDHVHAVAEEAIFSYNASQSFGWVTFDTERDDPEVRYQVISIEDEPVAELSVSLSQLRSPLTRLQMPHQERFEVAGRSAFLWLPEESLRQQPQPWIFYAPTLPAYPDEAERWMHERFLAAGIAVAGVDVGEAYGSPDATELFDALHRQLTEQRGFARRAVLFGRSRGGLWASSWAVRQPQWVAGLIGIYPVYDFLTYPGLEQAAPAYGLTPEQLQQRVLELNPVERLSELAAADIPVRLIHGDVDTVVPLEPNSGRLLEAYRRLGKDSLAELIVLEGEGHSFYRGFFESQPLVDFAIEHARRASSAVE